MGEPKCVKDLAEYIRTRPEKQSEKEVKIKTPTNVKEPLLYLAWTYNPADDMIKVLKVRQTRDKRAVVVQLSSGVDAAAMLEVPALKDDCTICRVYYRFPRLLVSRLNCDNKEQLVNDMFRQNEAAFNGDCNEFDSEFVPIRLWPSRERGTFTWLVQLSLPNRKFLLRSKAYMYRKRVRIIDHVGARRCFRCQEWPRGQIL